MSRLLVGTSGWGYPSWQPGFYPPGLDRGTFLSFYAERLPAVELNATKYRLPSEDQFRTWAEQVPDGFRFAVKAPRRITHIKRLKDCGDEVRYLSSALGALEPCLGSILFQLPPFFKRDVAVLAAFAEQLPAGCRAAFEFRHDSWFDEETYAVLRARNVALVQSEEADTPADRDLPWTADWAYLRLRKVDYAERDLTDWLGRLRAADLAEAQVFFKHEDEATGPKLAERFLELAAQA